MGHLWIGTFLVMFVSWILRWQLLRSLETFGEQWLDQGAGVATNKTAERTSNDNYGSYWQHNITGEMVYEKI